MGFDGTDERNDKKPDRNLHIFYDEIKLMLNTKLKQDKKWNDIIDLLFSRYLIGGCYMTGSNLPTPGQSYDVLIVYNKIKQLFSKSDNENLIELIETLCSSEPVLYASLMLKADEQKNMY